MTSKEKAEKLVQRFIYRRTDYVGVYDAKQCALIAVDEILEELEEISKRHYITKSPFDYFEQVKQEIENL